MWNKLFRKRSKTSSNKTGGADSNGTIESALRQPAPTTTCFSFGRKFDSNGNQSAYTRSSKNFQYLQYESKIYKRPGYNDDNEYPQLYQPHQQADENQQLNEIFIEIPPPNLHLEPCPVCSRKFSLEALRKHIVICERVSTKKRNVFDSSRQRLGGVEFTAVTSPSLPMSKFDRRVSPPKTLSRKASETSLKSAPGTTYGRSGTDSLRNSSNSLLGTPKPTMKRSISQAQQNEKCPYCRRCFGYRAFDRHVEWCKEKSLIKDSPDPANVSAAKERLKTRIHYKAPNLKTKKGFTREKYSTSCNGSTHSLDFDGMINSMSSSMTSESGLYDPFLSAKRQLEELFSPTTNSSETKSNKITPTATKNIVNSNNHSNSLMTRSVNLGSSLASPKTPQPVPKMSNFRRTSSLRVSNKKPKPLFTQPVRSNIQKGIDSDGPISPNFVKSADYDELPIKSPYSAIKMNEKPKTPSVRSPSPAQMPSIIMRDKTNNLLQRKSQFKLDIKNPNTPADYPISKTDSLALFLKYEQDLKASTKLSEKELKDKSNKTIMAKTEDAEKDHKLPDINAKPLQKMTTLLSLNNITNYSGNQDLISIDKLNQSNIDSTYNSNSNNYSGQKLINLCDNLPINNKNRSPDPSDNKPEFNESPLSSSGGTKRSLRQRQIKLNKDNILFDTAPEPEPRPTSQPRSESRNSNAESIFEDFDFNEFINSFNDDDQYPIFKEYKTMLNRSKEDTNNNLNLNSMKTHVDTPTSDRKSSPFRDDFMNGNKRQERQEMEIPGLDKLDNLGKLMNNPSDSDESTGNDIEHQTVRSKSSADSAYGSLSRQSPLDYRKNSNGNNFLLKTFQPTPYRQHLELKTTEIHLTPTPLKGFQETRPVREQTEDSTLTMSKFCHECGYRFVVSTAKFCIECGVRRIKI